MHMLLLQGHGLASTTMMFLIYTDQWREASRTRFPDRRACLSSWPPTWL